MQGQIMFPWCMRVAWLPSGAFGMCELLLSYPDWGGLSLADETIDYE